MFNLLRNLREGRATSWFASIVFVMSCVSSEAADGYWQQRVEYTMEIDFNVETHQFAGKQQIRYFNNSPDTITKVFYHLYFNAFQPGSMMDIRSRTIADPDRRVADRIALLQPGEIGYQKVNSLRQDGKRTRYEVSGTILEVALAHPLLPGGNTLLDMEFEAQVPLQIRRSGRDNNEGIAYSMSQWYPKLCEYDRDGWHPNPYIGREFYGVWGDFDVKITIDSDYTIGGTGYLQNASDIGHGYAEGPAPESVPANLTWHFVAPNVHDFMWAADPDYVHDTLAIEGGPTLHFFYDPGSANVSAWRDLPEAMDRALEFMNARYGEYPYDQYSFIQGGDGGMEYPMGTLITGNRRFESLVGVSIHEWMHSWYQMVLGTNESLYHWMDEGFTSFASAEVMNELARQGILKIRQYEENPFERTYISFAEFVRTGLEEPLTTHADHFQTNTAYGRAAYTKGSIFLNQLEYIIGEEAFARTLLNYYNAWKFKHPDVNDFIRIAEKQSGMVLDWYKEYWVNQTHTIDYAIDSLSEDGRKTLVHLSRRAAMPMPVELTITTKSGDEMTYYIALRMMRGQKVLADNGNWENADDWPWTYPFYTLEIPLRMRDISRIELDRDHKVMDMDRGNDLLELSDTPLKNRS